MLSLLARSSGRVVAAETLAKSAAARLLTTETPAPAAEQQRKPRKGRNLLLSDEQEQPADAKQVAPRKKKTFAFRNKEAQKEPEPELEVFDYPAYWDRDFPAGFDNSMKHEVEKLQIFSDFTPYLDLSWQKEIHELFDGEDIQLTLNLPLEDFDDRLFVDDKNSHDTKVVMEVPLSCFKGLTKDGVEIVKQLAGPRYNANKKHLKLTEDRYPTRVFNHKRLCDILRDLTQTAHELSTQQATNAPPSA
ncbi:hypothetical protein PybrP1_001181 [[Pythium] brassicae (nom. inval.)]|nr:hypothetical protein PybrP1_001181 [[Pythium] brassicae (nom. inval.)]